MHQIRCSTLPPSEYNTEDALCESVVDSSLL